MIYKYIYIIFFILCCTKSFAQILVIHGKDTSRFASEDDYYAQSNSREHYWIYLNEDGLRREEGNFVADKKEGTWISYYNNNNKCQEVEYKNNKADGHAKLYYEDGTLQEEGRWIDRHWAGEYRFYHRNGNPSYLWQYDESGKRTGLQQYFYENGMVMIEGEWREGKEQGVIREYYENGALKSEKTYNEGKCDTLSIKTFKNTAPTQATEVSLEKFSGNGFFKTLNKLRKVEFEGIWKNGKFVDGKHYIYDDTGRLAKIQIYRNGNKVSESQRKNEK